MTKELDSLKAEAKQYIDANVWDGEDRIHATGDMVVLNPADLQELVFDLVEHMASMPIYMMLEACESVTYIDKDSENAQAIDRIDIELFLDKLEDNVLGDTND